MWLKNPSRRPIPLWQYHIFYDGNIIAIKGIEEMGQERYLKLPDSFKTSNKGTYKEFRKRNMTAFLLIYEIITEMFIMCIFTIPCYVGSFNSFGRMPVR